MRTTNKKNDEENSHDRERTTKADVATPQDIIFLVAASIILFQNKHHSISKNVSYWLAVKHCAFFLHRGKK